VKLFRVRMQGGEAVLAMSSRTWISYYYSNRFHLTPLSYETLEYAAGFSSEQCPEGIVAISTNTLRYLFCDSPFLCFFSIFPRCIPVFSLAFTSLSVPFLRVL
jgi:hypothetical protein